MRTVTRRKDAVVKWTDKTAATRSIPNTMFQNYIYCIEKVVGNQYLDGHISLGGRSNCTKAPARALGEFVPTKHLVGYIWICSLR